MSAPRRGRGPHEPRFRTANEAWKARWDDCLAWSTMVAVAAHAAAFAFSPGWDPLDSWLEPDLELLETGSAWILLDAAPSSGGGGGMAVASPASLQEPDSLPAGLDAGIRIGGSELAALAFSGGLRERLLGRGRPVPTIVEPEREPAPTSAPLSLEDDAPDTAEPDTQEEEGEGEEVRVIVPNPIMADPSFRLETGTLNLSRLAGTNPQLLMPGTSAWLLIRNPAKVEQFMRVTAFVQDSDAPGQVDVAVWIDTRGSVEWSEITRSSGHEEMDEAALALFNEVASFQPARDQGVHVSMSVIFSVSFPW